MPWLLYNSCFCFLFLFVSSRSGPTEDRPMLVFCCRCCCCCRRIPMNELEDPEYSEQQCTKTSLSLLSCAPTFLFPVLAIPISRDRIEYMDDIHPYIHTYTTTYIPVPVHVMDRTSDMRTCTCIAVWRQSNLEPKSTSLTTACHARPPLHQSQRSAVNQRA